MQLLKTDYLKSRTCTFSKHECEVSRKKMIKISYNILLLLHTICYKREIQFSMFELQARMRELATILVTVLQS